MNETEITIAQIRALLDSITIADIERLYMAKLRLIRDAKPSDLDYQSNHNFWFRECRFLQELATLKAKL